MKRKLSGARAAKLLRELEKREPKSIEYDDLKRKADVEELRALADAPKGEGETRK